MAQPLPTPLQRFRENHHECRGVSAARQHSRTFSTSGKGLKSWALILSPTLRARETLLRCMSPRARSLLLSGSKHLGRSYLFAKWPIGDLYDLTEWRSLSRMNSPIARTMSLIFFFC